MIKDMRKKEEAAAAQVNAAEIDKFWRRKICVWFPGSGTWGDWRYDIFRMMARKTDGMDAINRWK